MAKTYQSAPDLTIDLDGRYGATLHTSLGDITVEFLAAEAPQTVNNFLFLAGEGFYDGVVFHRVIPGFMIQGGDPTGTGRGGPGYKFRDELEGQGKYTRGTMAMANAGPNTNGSQFFMMHQDYGLPHQYSIFGKVTSGLEIVDAIAALPTGAQDRPHDPPMIKSITITEG
ncbi:MAG TPA: peptidylprolyl isomerase [Actinobacteria bacterium]|nr:peptidylprolyl isomerase [Actinomycetota bacterium]